MVGIAYLIFLGGYLVTHNIGGQCRIFASSLNPSNFNHTSGNHKIQDQEDEKKHWRQKPGISMYMETQIPTTKRGEQII